MEPIRPLCDPAAWEGTRDSAQRPKRCMLMTLYSHNLHLDYYLAVAGPPNGTNKVFAQSRQLVIVKEGFLIHPHIQLFSYSEQTLGSNKTLHVCKCGLIQANPIHPTAVFVARW